MGIYVAPRQGTQQQFLLRHGRIIDEVQVREWDYYNATELPVAYHVPNSGEVRVAVVTKEGHIRESAPFMCDFEASMVVCSASDAARVTSPKETRTIIFYAVPVSILVDPELGQVPPDRLKAYRPYIINGVLYD